MNQNTNVNLIPKFPFSGNLYFSQYDVGRVATINLVEDGSAYTIPSGATVKIQATKPSGLGFSVECTYNGNVVTVVSTETMTNEYGRFPCELRIESGDVLLGTTNFTFNVEKSPHPTNTVDGDSEDIINQITVALNNALSDIQDAKEEAIEEISQSGGGITQAVKVALLNCFAHTAWIDVQGKTYYDALYNALYDVPAPTLTSISAVYTQSGTVYDTDTLDSLKSDLVVTATYSDSSTVTVPSADYTLSGTLAEGTSTITVTYQGMTATFDVTVSGGERPLYYWDFTNSLTDEILNANFVINAVNGSVLQTSDGLEFSAGNIDFNAVVKAENLQSLLDTKIEIEMGNMTYVTGNAGSGNAMIFSVGSGPQLYWRNASNKWSGWINNGWQDNWYTTITDKNYFSNKTIIIRTYSNGRSVLSVDDTVILTIPAGTITELVSIALGRASGQAYHNMIVKKITVYRGADS